MKTRTEDSPISTLPVVSPEKTQKSSGSRRDGDQCKGGNTLKEDLKRIIDQMGKEDLRILYIAALELTKHH